MLVSKILIIRLISIRKFQNVPSGLGFEVKHLKILCRSFRGCIIILSMVFTINKLFWSLSFLKMIKWGHFKFSSILNYCT